MVDLRRSLTVSSDFYYYGLGARFWIEQDSLGGPETFAELLERWGFYKNTGIDLTGEQAGRIPSPEWLKRRSASRSSASRTPSWRTGNSVNMAIGQGDVLVTPLQLASAYATHRQRRHPLAAPRGQGDPRRRHRRGQADHRPEAARHRRDAAGRARRRSSTASSASPPERAAPPSAPSAGSRPRGVPGGGQDRHGPGERQGAHGGVRRLRAGVRSRSTRSSVLLEESGYGGSGGRPGRPPALRRPVGRGAAPTRSGGRPAEPTPALSCPMPGTCATDGAPPSPPRPRSPPARSAGCRATRRRPGGTSTSCCVGCIVAVGALGCLMIFSATRGPRPRRLRHELPRQAGAVHGHRVRGDGGDRLVDYRRYRELAPLAYGGVMLLLLLVVTGLGSEQEGHPGLVPARARSSCSPPSWPRSW